MKASATETAAARVWRLNFLLSTSTLAKAAAGLEALGLEAKEFFVLDGVEELAYPAQLAERLSMPKPTVTLYVKNLEAKGFLRREIDQEDLRRHRLALTEAGGETVNRARAVLADSYGERLSLLTDQERRTFQHLLEKLNL